MAQAAWGQMEGNAQPVPAGQPGPMPEQPSISLSAQAELELELSLRGSLLVQQQRRIVQLEDELQRAWAEIDRLRTKIAAVERERQRSDDDAAKQVRLRAADGRWPTEPCIPPPAPLSQATLPKPVWPDYSLSKPPLRVGGGSAAPLPPPSPPPSLCVVAACSPAAPARTPAPAPPGQRPDSAAPTAPCTPLRVL